MKNLFNFLVSTVGGAITAIVLAVILLVILLIIARYKQIMSPMIKIILRSKELYPTRIHL